nr:MAG TPA: hypothetical protein [Caudoviricetes sp.]
MLHCGISYMPSACEVKTLQAFLFYCTSTLLTASIPL